LLDEQRRIHYARLVAEERLALTMARREVALEEENETTAAEKWEEGGGRRDEGRWEGRTEEEEGGK